MSTRMDKYSSNIDSGSRSSRNKQLYEDLYNTGNYSNSIVIDQSEEIDISKIKEIVEREKKLSEKKEFRPEINFDNIVKEETETKIYDINEVLKNAKNKRDIIEEASERRKNSKYESHLNIEEELSKTRQVYDKLLQEETELLDIMNTLTNVQTSSGTNSYKDITSDSVKQKTNTNTITVKRVELPTKEEKKEGTKEYSTNTFMFNKKDFIEEELEDSIRESNIFIKILIVLLTIAILWGAYFVITTYILK